MHKLLILWFLLVGYLKRPLGTRADIEAWQRKRLQRFAKKILTKSPYYRRYLQDGQLDMSALPVMTKETYVENFSSINTCGIDRDTALALALASEQSRDFSSHLNGVTVGLSTGTSGKRSLFLVSGRERALWAANIMRRILLPRLRRPGRIAFFLRANSGLYESIGSHLFRFQYFDLMRPFTDLLPELAAMQPNVLAAPPSILMRLVDESAKGAITLQPRLVVSFAEVLHDDVRTKIHKVFGVDPINVYQCTEGFIGLTCEYGTMHLLEDVMHIEQEWIDEHHYRPIITDFTRNAVPIVRYRMTDVLKHRADPCACGSPMLAVECIVGRDDDVLLFRNTDDVETPIYPDILSRAIALQTDNYHTYTVKQSSWTDIIVQVDAPEDVRPETERSIANAIQQVCSVNKIDTITIHIQPYVAQSQGMKQRRFHCML